MAYNRVEAELIIRARQIGAETISATAAALDKLNAKLLQQAAAAQRGEASTKDLEATLKALQQLGEQIISTQVGVVAKYEDLAAQLAVATQKADGLRAQQQAMTAAQAAASSVTKGQADNLEKLNNRVTAADKAVARATGNLEKQGAVVQRLGGDLNNLAAFNNRIDESARNVGTAISATGAILGGYEEHIRAVKAAEASLAETDAFGKRVQGAEELLRVNQRIADMEHALREAEYQPLAADVDAFNKKQGEITQLNLRNQAIHEFTIALEQSEAAARRQTELVGFRQQGADALVAAGQLNQLTTAERAVAASSQSLAGAIQAILDPSAAARATLAGLEGELARVNAEIGNGKKPIGDYQDAVRDLDRIKSSIEGQTKTVDQFRAQAAVVDELTAKYKTNLAAVRARANAVLGAKDVDEAQITAMHEEQQAVAGTSAQLTTQIEKLNTLKAALEKAGIDANGLADAENRLKTAAVGTAAGVQKLQVAASGKETALGGILGLKPYQITNLGYQINDVATQLASGTSVLQTFAQQAGQFAQIPGVLAGIVRFFPALAAIVAILGTMFLAFKRIFDLTSDIREFTHQLELSTDGAVYNAKALALNAQALRDLGLSSKEAKEAISEFVQIGLDPSRIVQFGKAALDLSRITGVDVPTATKLLVAGFSGGYAAIRKMDDQLHILSPTQRAAIRDLYDHGKAAEGAKMAFDIYYDKLEEVAHHERGDWAEALHAFGNSFRSFLEFLGNSPAVQEKISQFKALGEAMRWVATHLPGSADVPVPGAPVAPAPSGEVGPDGKPLLPGQRRVVAATGSVGVVGTPTDTLFANTPEQQAQAQDYRTDLKRAQDAVFGLKDDQIIINAGIKAYADALEKTHNTQLAGEAQIAAIQLERFKIGKQRLEEEQTLADQLKSSLIAAGQADDKNLGARLLGVQATLADQLKKVSDARAKGVTGIDLPGLGTVTLAQAEKTFRAQASIIGQQTTMTFYEEQLNELEKEYGDLVGSANAQYAARSITAAQAADKIKAAQDSILPKITAVTDKAIAFGNALSKAGPSPKTMAFLEKFKNAKVELLSKGDADALKGLTDDVTKAQTALGDKLKSIQQDFQEGAIGGAEAIERAEKAQAELTPDIIAAAKAAEDYARNLNSVRPSPQLGAIIDKNAAIGEHATDNNPKTSAVGKFELSVVTNDEQKLNQAIQERNTLAETYNALVEAGVLSEADAEAKRKELYESTAPIIQAQIDEIQGLIGTLRGKEGADLPLLDTLVAKLQLAGAQTQYVDKDVESLGKTINDSIASQAVTAFDSAGEAIGNAIVGTESWGDALSDLGRASANFFAGLLKDIAEAIIKMEILSALGISGGGAGGGGFGGTIASFLLGGGGSAVASGAEANSIAVAGFNSLVLHNGTEGNGTMTRSGMDPALWDNAPRYHEGTPGVGLSPGEQRAILMDGEAVLKENDPHHPKNRGKLGARGAPAAPSLKQILLLDPKDIQGAMAAPGGVDVILTVLKSNAQTANQILGRK